jgi:hypothetical protein
MRTNLLRNLGFEDISQKEDMNIIRRHTFLLHAFANTNYSSPELTHKHFLFGFELILHIIST